VELRNADTPAKYYAKDNSLVFYDYSSVLLSRLKEYRDGVEKGLFANMASGQSEPPAKT